MSVFEKTFAQAVSLGADCRVRYQLSLARWRRAQPQPPRRFWQRRRPLDVAAFEADLYGKGAVSTPHGSYPFDWLVTHGVSLVDVLEADFRSFFEWADLKIDPGTRLVVNVRTGIHFPHAFKIAHGTVSELNIHRGYQAQRQKFEHLVDKFRALRGHSVLYVVCGNQAPEFVDRIRVATGNPRAHVLSVRPVPQPRGLVHDAEGVTIFEISDATTKPAHAQWQGDDVHWGALLDRIHLGA